MPLDLATTRRLGRRLRLVDWPLVFYSGGAGVLGTAMISLTAKWTAGVEGWGRLAAVLGTGLAVVRAAILMADVTIRRTPPRRLGRSRKETRERFR